MRFKTKWICFTLLFFVVLMLSIPIVHGDPVFPQIYFDYGALFLLFFIVPFSFIYASFIEFGGYYAFLRKEIKNVIDLLKLALIINFITVPLTQYFVYLTSHLINDLWIIILIEGVIIIVEFLLFRNEIKTKLIDSISNTYMLLIIFMANLVSFLFGFIFFDILLSLFWNLRYNYFVIPFNIAPLIFVSIFIITPGIIGIFVILLKKQPK